LNHQAIRIMNVGRLNGLVDGMIQGFRHCGHWSLCILCAFAFLLLGLVHRPPVADAAPIPPGEVAAYLLPDGTLPVLCLPSTEGKPHHREHEGAPFCEACRLAAAIMLPAPAGTLGAPMLRETAEEGVPISGISPLPAQSSGISARGPPLSLKARTASVS
jgi:hypothetical protein